MKERLTDILKKNGVTGLTIADVGAKDRLDFIHELSKITILHAFEPNPSECKKLGILYKDHSFRSLQLNETGLGEKAGPATFHLSKHNSMSSLLKPDIENYEKHFGTYREFGTWKEYIQTEETISINVQTADEYFKNTTIDYLKLDTQGSELSILKGAKELIANKKIQVIKVEVSTVPIYKDQALFADIDLFLRAHHYTLIDLITYRNEYTPVLNTKYTHTHYAPCGDAIYVLEDSQASGTINIKKGILLHWLGYTGIADFYLKKADLSIDEISSIKTIKSVNHTSFLNRFIKNMVPPVLYRLIKRNK